MQNTNYVEELELLNVRTTVLFIDSAQHFAVSDGYVCGHHRVSELKTRCTQHILDAIPHGWHMFFSVWLQTRLHSLFVFLLLEVVVFCTAGTGVNKRRFTFRIQHKDDLDTLLVAPQCNVMHGTPISWSPPLTLKRSRRRWRRGAL